ncbi:MAG: UDP-N-acetylmuramoyl-L-alanyl-D-glutamate--2,6-diaminopimelate ligase [Patescibacteria group bacterium]
MKNLLKKMLPVWALDAYHRLLSWVAAVRFGYPSERLIVIGVTGTNGKSTTCNMIARVLEGSGHKVGLTTTANFKIAEREWLNDKKMTMLGRFQLQRLLRDMVKAGCRYAVIETSSEGIRQHRHRGINFDIAVFTNLTPEHIESHGGFENYKRAKGELFAKLSHDQRKTFAGAIVPKTIIVNAMDEHAGYFLNFLVDSKIGFAVPRTGNQAITIKDESVSLLKAENVDINPTDSTWQVEGVNFALRLPGQFNLENAMAAVAVGQALGLKLEDMALALAELSGVPGRLEFIDEGQSFTALVDYAPEPESFRKLYEVVDRLKKNRVIHVLGSCGGGRDISRRPILGRLAAEKAQIVIVTNEDPYDDDPQEIIEDVAAGARACGLHDEQNLFAVPDRGEAIDRAVDLAEPGDLVLLTGKGCEQAIAVANGRKIPWDDRERLRQAIKRKLTAQSRV